MKGSLYVKLGHRVEVLEALPVTDKFDARMGDWWRDHGCLINVAPPFLGTGRVLLVGDATGLCCLSGGITSALDTGYRCGRL
jgi:flavin-dependent dehydrogenase